MSTLSKGRRTHSRSEVGDPPAVVTAYVTAYALGTENAVVAAGGDEVGGHQMTTTTVSAEAGVGNANPSVTRSGTIQYWNGTGYTSLAVTTGAGAAIPVSAVSFTSGLDTVSLSASLRTGATVAAACASPCYSALAKADSAIVGDIFVRVVSNGVTKVDLQLHVDFGTLTASSTYKVAS